MRVLPNETETLAMACPKCGALPYKRCRGRGIRGRRTHVERSAAAEDALSRYDPPAESFVVPSIGRREGVAFSGGRRVLPAKACE